MKKARGILFSVKDPLGRTIHVTRHCWEHAKSRHAELVGQEAALKETLETPDLVEDDQRGGWRYYRRNVPNMTAKYLMAVICALREESNEYLFVTAHAMRNRKKGGVVAWQRKKLS